MDAKLNQSDLISLLAKGRNISVAKAELFTKNFFDLIIEGLEQDGIVKINGLGTFKITDVASRGSVNVNTGEKIEIKGHNKLTFIPADALKDEVNQPFAMFEPVEIDDIYQPDSANETETDEVVETLAVIPAETEMSAVEEKDVEETEKVQVEEEPVAEAVVTEVVGNNEETESLSMVEEEKVEETATGAGQEPVVVQQRPVEPVIVRVPKKNVQSEQKTAPKKRKKRKSKFALFFILGFAVGFILINRMSREGLANEDTATIDTLQVIATTANKPEVIVDDIHATDTILETPAVVLPAETDLVVETVDDNAVADEPAVEDVYTFVLTCCNAMSRYLQTFSLSLITRNRS